MKQISLLLVGLLFLAVFDVAMAARPVALDNWTVTSGLVDAPCPAAMTCDQIVIDDGFMQRRLTSAAGASYYQFITTDSGGVTGNPAAALDFSANTLEFSHEVFSRTQSSVVGTDPFYGQTNIASSSMDNGIESRLAQTADFANTTNNGNIAVDLFNELTVIDWNQPTPEVLLHQRFEDSASRLGDLVRGRVTGVFSPNPSNPRVDLTGNLQQTVSLGNGDYQGFIKKFILNWATSLTSVPYDQLGGRNPELWVGLFRASPTVDSQFSPFSYTRYNAGVANNNGLFRISPPSVPTSQWRYEWRTTGKISFTDANPFVGSQYFNGTGTEVFLKENFNIVRTPPTAYNPNPLVAFSDFLTFDGNPDYLDNQTRPSSITPVSPTANGGPPTALDQWSVSNGVITAPCPVGAVCSATTSENGFLLRGVSIGGIDYFQTIITEDNATGAATAVVASESFVRADSVNGIATTQRVSFAPVPSFNAFAYSASINSGWALSGPGDAALVIRQKSSSTEFHLRMAANGAKDYTVFNNYFLSDINNGSRQNRFYSRTIEGGIQNTSRALDPLNPLLRGGGLGFVGDGTASNCRPIASAGPLGSECRGTSQNADLAWSAGDALQLTWIGSSWGGFRGTVPGLRTDMTSVTNLTTGDRAQVSQINLPASPVRVRTGSWSAPFDMPTLPDTYVPRF